MSSEVFNNFVLVTLASPAGSGDTTITCAGNYAGLSATGNYRLLVDTEIMLATSRAGAVITVTRGMEGTTAAAHSSGAQVIPALTAAAIAAALSGADAVNRVSDANFTFTAAVASASAWLRSLSANRTITLDAAPPFTGCRRVIKDEDGSLSAHSIVIQGNGNTIDGASSYTMTAALLGPHSAVTLEWNGVAWGQI